MTDQKLMVRSKYEKYEMLLVRPHKKGSNKLSITQDSVKKKTGPSIPLSPARWHSKHTYLSSLGILGKNRTTFLSDNCYFEIQS